MGSRLSDRMCARIQDAWSGLCAHATYRTHKYAHNERTLCNPIRVCGMPPPPPLLPLPPSSPSSQTTDSTGDSARGNVCYARTRDAHESADVARTFTSCTPFTFRILAQVTVHSALSMCGSLGAFSFACMLHVATVQHLTYIISLRVRLEGYTRRLCESVLCVHARSQNAHCLANSQIVQGGWIEVF